MFLISRKSREKREKPGPMNLSHTDLTNLTDGASLRPRLSALPSALSRMVHTSASDVCFREIREICVRIKYLREDRLLKHKLLRHLFSVILTSVSLFLLVVFICCSRRAARLFAKGSAVVREEQRGRSRTANNFAL